MTIAPLIAALMLIPGQMVDEILTETNAQDTLEAVRSPEASPQPEPTQSPAPEPVAAPEPKPVPPRINISPRQQRIANCEGYPRYVNRSHPGPSTASGKYGYLDGTWNNFKGYARAMYAPEWIQDQRAASDLAQFGPSAWNASRHCWGVIE